MMWISRRIPQPADAVEQGLRKPVLSYPNPIRMRFCGPGYTVIGSYSVRSMVKALSSFIIPIFG